MIAIIAGTGALPLEACKYFLTKEEPFFVVSLFEENRKALLELIESKSHLVAQPFYKVSGIMKTLKDYKTQKLLFIGKVDKQNLLQKMKFDWLYFKLASQLLYKSDSSIMNLLVATLAQNNIEVIPQNIVLKNLLVPPGILTGTFTKEMNRDIKLGMDTAHIISQSDIGQTVIVKDGMVLAIEAIEGTDSCIKRGIELGKRDIVICKNAHKNKNVHFDLPTLGPSSLSGLRPGDVKAIAWGASKTLIVQKEEFIKKAQDLGITLISQGEENNTHF